MKNFLNPLLIKLREDAMNYYLIKQITCVEHLLSFRKKGLITAQFRLGKRRLALWGWLVGCYFQNSS